MAGIGIGLLAATQASADDTELLLINPDPSRDPRPNVMFILDTSGSMTTTQFTVAPYDSNRLYSGDCESDSIYWTDVDVVPDCGTTDNIIRKTAFYCDYASPQMAGIGSFTNTMVQYRGGGKDGQSPGPARWQYLAPGYPDSPVECQADSGEHGDGRPTHLWAASGTNLADAFTDDPAGELSWGSAPRNLGYTFYDGNYLNWRNSPETVSLSRAEIMQEVMRKMLSSVNNLNVGIMRFDGADGGPVILDITNLDENRQKVIDVIDDLPAIGVTPLSETLFEAALFWRGMAAHFGQPAYTGLTDADALATTNPYVYEPPAWDACSRNYNVLLTDGAPVMDEDTPGLVGTLPGMAGTLGFAGCDGSGEGYCLDDVAAYLSRQDVDPLADGDQLVTTHTIGFTVDLPILAETASDSGGRYFLADDVESLTRTLLAIIADINDRSLSFGAPAVSVNTFNRTRNVDDLYITTFRARAKAHWPGNLKKYRIHNRNIVDANNNDAIDPATGFFSDSAQSYWTSGGPDGHDVILGGAAQQLPAPDMRRLFSNYVSGALTATQNSLAADNGALEPADFGLTGASGEPSLASLLNWMHGEDVRDEDNNPATTQRNAMGDAVHSQPAAVVYGGSADNPDIVIYTATNDGYLHAIAGDDGRELWAFLPKSLLGNMRRLYFDPDSKYKHYGIDGNIVPVTKDVDNDGVIEPAEGDFVYLVFGMRRGGETYFALDVSIKHSPRLLWTFESASAGQSWSAPAIARVDVAGVSQNPDNAVVIFGGGYDTVHDTTAFSAPPDGSGASIHMLDLASGTELWRAGPDSGADLRLNAPGREMHRAIPNQVRVIDFSGDGLADRMYATDLGGQIWRFDVSNGQEPSGLVAGGIIARLGAAGSPSPSAADTRRFYNAPDVSLISDQHQQRRYIAVSVGSGYRAHPFDLSAADRFFSIRDPDVFNSLSQSAYDDYPIAGDADLIEVSGKTQTVITANDRGWKFTLPGNEKVLSDSITFDDQVLFVSFTPDSLSAAGCAAGTGSNFLYRMQIVNGDPVVPNIEAVDPAFSNDLRRDDLQQGGIAPTPVIVFPGPDEDCQGIECRSVPLSCVGVECFEPGFDPFPKRTLWTQDGIE